MCILFILDVLENEADKCTELIKRFAMKQTVMILSFPYVQVNDVEVAGWDSESVIDLLRKTRGRISLGVLQ